MSNVIISTTEDYIVVKIPKKSLIGQRLYGKKTLSEDKALRIFKAAKKDYQLGKLKDVESLAQLL